MSERPSLLSVFSDAAQKETFRNILIAQLQDEVLVPSQGYLSDDSAFCRLAQYFLKDPAVQDVLVVATEQFLAQGSLANVREAVHILLQDQAVIGEARAERVRTVKAEEERLSYRAPTLYGELESGLREFSSSNKPTEEAIAKLLQIAEAAYQENPDNVMQKLAHFDLSYRWNSIDREELARAWAPIYATLLEKRFNEVTSYEEKEGILLRCLAANERDSKVVDKIYYAFHQCIEKCLISHAAASADETVLMLGTVMSRARAGLEDLTKRLKFVLFNPDLFLVGPMFDGEPEAVQLALLEKYKIAERDESHAASCKHYAEFACQCSNYEGIEPLARLQMRDHALNVGRTDEVAFELLAFIDEGQVPFLVNDGQFLTHAHSGCSGALLSIVRHSELFRDDAMQRWVRGIRTDIQTDPANYEGWISGVFKDSEFKEIKGFTAQCEILWEEAVRAVQSCNPAAAFKVLFGYATDERHDLNKKARTMLPQFLSGVPVMAPEEFRPPVMA